MQELSQLLIRAKEKKCFDSLEFKILIQRIAEFEEYSLDWDVGAGEEWARFLNTNLEIVLMLNVKIGIVFLKKGSVLTDILDILKDLFIVEVDSYGMDEWCIDISKLESNVPEINWRASKDAVDTEKMSLQDLYYATV